MKKRHIQKGAVSAIAVFILFVVIASMVTVALNLSRSSLSDANMQNNSTQATYLAESALERTTYKLNTDPNCNNLTSPDKQTLGSGTFEIVSINVINAALECYVKVKAEKNGIVRYINTKLVNLGGSGTGSGGANVSEQFDYANTAAMTTIWAETLTQNKGTSRWDSANCDATCVGAIGGSFYAETNGTGFLQTKRLRGYRERNITAIDTSATGVTLNLAGAFKKASSSTNAIQQDISIEVYVSGNEAATLKALWSDTAVSSANAWLPISTATPLSANLLYDRLRIRFDLAGMKYNIKGTTVDSHALIWVDEIFLSTGVITGIAPDWQVVEWQEVSN